MIHAVLEVFCNYFAKGREIPIKKKKKRKKLYIYCNISLDPSTSTNGVHTTLYNRLNISKPF